MSYISLSQAFSQWLELAADIPKDDTVMLSESWNDYTDSLCKDGELCALQYHYAPSYNEDIPGDGSKYDALKDDRGFILERMGVTVDSVFVPLSASRNKDEKHPSINWRVTLKKNGREVLTADYMQGSAHAPAHTHYVKFGNGKKDEYETNRAVRQECETGRRATVNGQRANFGKAFIGPDVIDVLYCFLSDSRVLDARDFADWANDMGMDSDSIKARATYDACMADALKMRAAFGDKTMSELHELFEDM